MTPKGQIATGDANVGLTRYLGKFGTSLNVRLTVLFILVALVPMLTIATLSIQKAGSALNDVGLSKVAQETGKTKDDLLTFIGQFSTDVLMLSDTPPVQAVIRAVDNDGIDPKSNDAYGVWVNRLTQIFAASARNKGYYQQIRYIDATGQEMVRVDYANGAIEILSGTDRLQNKSGADYLEAARNLKTGEVYVSELNLNRESGQITVPHTPVIRYSTPIISPAGEFRGVVVANVYANSFLDRLVADDGALYLSTEDGSFARHADSSMVFGGDLKTGVDIDTEFSAEHEELANTGGQPVAWINSDRGEVVALESIEFDHANPDRHWLIARTFPTDAVTGPVTALRNTVIVVALVLIAIVAVLAFWLARGITRPLVKIGGVLQELATKSLPQLSSVTSAIGAGDLTQRSKLSVERAEITSRNEIGNMATAFNAVVDEISNVSNGVNDMTDRLGNVIGEFGQAANKINAASGNLAEAAGQAGDGTTGIASSSQEVASGSNQQRQGVEDITSLFNELSKAIDTIADGSKKQTVSIEEATGIVGEVSRATSDMATNAQEATDGARSAADASDEGLGTVRETIAGMEKITVAVDTAAKQIESLGEQSAEIGKIVGVIDDIAAQTNLLALNAAIEAARAGEQGRGFAVVADEVRQLAERVTQATSEIAGLIDAVQNGVDQSVQAAEQAGTDVEVGSGLAKKSGEALEAIQQAVSGVSGQIEQISASAEEVSASADEMVRTIGTVDDVTKQNSAAAEEMTASSDSVRTAVDGISSITEQAAAAAQEMSASTEEVGAKVQEVVTSTQGLSEMAVTLQETVDQFKLNDSNAA
jgi:methyl-accepting chemotaxis protein